MSDCSYCGESFNSESDYLAHLETAHEDELGPIDRRRIGDDEEEGIGLRGIIVGALVVIPVVVVAYVLFFTGNTPSSGLENPVITPTNVGSVHEHGTINVTIGGTELDFSRGAFQNAREYGAFHFEGGDGEVWHVHAQQVTLQYAMWTLGIGVTEDSVRYDGETYTEENATVIVEVNGEPVDPTTYELSGASAANAENGDHIRIVAHRE
ncbi:MAG: C2H2-type zinc finger protein [Halobacteriales archaeon]